MATDSAVTTRSDDATTDTTPPRPGRLLPRLTTFRHGRWPFIIAIVILLLLVVIPLIQLVVTSLHAGTPGRPGDWTFDKYSQALSSSTTWVALRNTLVVAVFSTAFSLTAGVFFAWLLERTDVPFRNLGWALLLLPIAVPGILLVLAWATLLAPRSGLLNVPVREVLGWLGIDFTEGPLNIYSMKGVIFLDSMRGVTTVFLMMVGAFRIFDPSLEEAARVSGASTFATLRKVTLPALVPALLAAAIYSFISGMDQFEAALGVGLPGGVFLLGTLTYFTVQMRVPTDYGLGAVYALIFMLIMVLLVIVYRRMVRYSERFVTVTGKGYRPRRIGLGRWRYPAFLLVLAYGGLTLIIPVALLVWLSLRPQFTAISWVWTTDYTFDNYTALWQTPSLLRIFVNTLVMTIGTATATMVLAFLVAWAIVRGASRGRGVLDGLSFLPYAFPGITIALAMMVVFLNPPLNVLPVYGSILVLIIALTMQYVAFGTRLMSGAIVQIQKELEEAGRVSGARQFTVLRRLTAPLLLPSLVSGWVWVFAHSIRAFSVPAVLASGSNEVAASHIWHAWELGHYGEAAAMGSVLIFLLFPVTILMRRFMVKASGSAE